MRVLHVVTAFPRWEDDVITPWLVELVARGRERGLEAEVLAPAYRGKGARDVAGIPVHRFRYAPAAWETLTHDESVPERIRRSRLHAARVPLYLVGGTLAAWRRARRRPPDIVHVHWPMPHAIPGVAARRASRGRSALVCSYYAVEINWVEHRLPWLRPLLRWTARTADQTTAISTSTARSLRELAGVEPRVVPFAAANVSTGESDRLQAREPLEDGGPLRILFVGRLVERKGVEVLVRALDRLSRHRPARLTIVGEGEREASIRTAVREAGVADRVDFRGYLGRDELMREYAGCDVFVLPAVVDSKGDTEGLGVVLLEALRFERPVVASDLGGIPDIVEHGRTGWLVPPGDPVALADRLLEITRSPEEARRVAREGRRIAARRFGWERILDDLESTYRDAVDHRRGERGTTSRGTRETVTGEERIERQDDHYRRFLRSETYRRQRIAKARVVARLCRRELETARRVGDLGAGTGLVKRELERETGKPIFGFELDASFMEETRRMVQANVTRLPLRDGSLDFVLANHLYEHVRDQGALFRELCRVLSPEGAAYVPAGNRLALVEPHYRLPFLSWLPRRAADWYLRLTGRGTEYRGIRFRTYGALTGLMRDAGLDVEDRTRQTLDEFMEEVRGPRWGALWRMVRRLPEPVLERLLRWFCPQWFFMVRPPRRRP